MSEKPPNPENLENEIEQLLEELAKFDFESLSEELQEEWYYVEMEAKVSKKRETALLNLQNFLEKLSKI